MMQLIRFDGSMGERYGVRVVRSARIQGLALSALRHVSVGELAYLTDVVLVPASAKVILNTPLGEWRLNPANHGFQISAASLRRFAKPLVARFAELYDVDRSDHGSLSRVMTDNGCLSWAVAGLGEAVNHAENPNVEPSFDRIERTPDGFSMPFIARRAIAPGDELALNYRTVVPLLKLPFGWAL